MNKFKQTGLAAAFAVAALFGAQSAFAAPPLNLTTGDTITLGYGGLAQGDPYGGGPFQATGASVANGSSGSFITFCIEYNEEFYPGGTYYIRVNTGAVNGGVSTAGTYPTDVNGTSTFDPVSNATAWLYTAYRTNQSLLWTGSETSATDLSVQLAIWDLEGELSSSVSPGALAAYNGDSLAQGFVTSAVNAATLGYTNSNVKAMNLYSSYSGGVFSGNAQDQLYLAPVPEPETYALLLAGLGFLGFMARRRKQKIA